jgi:hypothetical protein
MAARTQFNRSSRLGSWKSCKSTSPPVLLGGGIRLFDRIDPKHVELEITRVIESPNVTHLGYRVVKED